MFKSTYLCNGKGCDIGGGQQLTRATRAVFHVGEVCAGDLLYLENGMASIAVAFYHDELELVIELDVLECLGGDTTVRDKRSPSRRFVESQMVVDTCVWYELRPGIIKLCLPPAVLFS